MKLGVQANELINQKAVEDSKLEHHDPSNNLEFPLAGIFHVHYVRFVVEVNHLKSLHREKCPSHILHIDFVAHTDEDKNEDYHGKAYLV